MSQSLDNHDVANPDAEKVLESTELKEPLQECVKDNGEKGESEKAAERSDENQEDENDTGTPSSSSGTPDLENSGESMPLILDELQRSLDISTSSACSGGGGCNDKNISKGDSTDAAKHSVHVVDRIQTSSEEITRLERKETGKDSSPGLREKNNRGVPISKEVNEKDEHYEDESDEGEESGTTDEGEDDDEDENESYESISTDEQDSRPAKKSSPKTTEDAQFSTLIDGIRNSLTSTKLDSASIANSANEADLLISAIESSDPTESTVLHDLYKSLRLLERTFVTPHSGRQLPVSRSASRDEFSAKNVDKAELINVIDRLKDCLIGRSEVNAQSETNHAATNSVSTSSSKDVIQVTNHPETVPSAKKMALNKQESISSSESTDRVPWQVRANRRRSKTRSYSTGVTLEEIADARKYLEEEAMRKTSAADPPYNRQDSQEFQVFQTAQPQVFRDSSVPDMSNMAGTPPSYATDGSYSDLSGSQKFNNTQNDFPFLKGSLQYYPPSSQVVSNQELYYPNADAKQVNTTPKYKPFRTFSLDSDYETGQGSFIPDQHQMSSAIYESNLRKRVSEDEGRKLLVPIVPKFPADFRCEQSLASGNSNFIADSSSVTSPTRVTYQFRPGSTGQLADAAKSGDNGDRQIALPFATSPISINSNLGGSNRVDNVQISLTEFNNAEFPAQLQIAITLKSNNAGKGGYTDDKNTIQSIDVQLNNDLDKNGDATQSSCTEADNPKLARYQNKKDRKKRMKRANTIDIPQPPGLVPGADAEDDVETEDSNSNLCAHIPFQPKTEGDRKFLAFLEKNNAFDSNRSMRPSYLGTNDRQWNNRFSNLKTSFESGGSSPSVSPQPMSHKARSVAEIAMVQNQSRGTPEIVSKPIWASNRVSPLPSNIKHKLQVFETQQSENIPQMTHSPFMSSQMKTSLMNTSQDKQYSKYSQGPQPNSKDYKPVPSRDVGKTPFIPPTLMPQSIHTKLPQPMASPPTAKREGVHMVHATASAMQALNQPKKVFPVAPQVAQNHNYRQQTQSFDQNSHPVSKPSTIRKGEPDQTPRVSTARSIFENLDSRNQSVVAGKLSLSLNDNNMMPKRPERKHFEKDLSYHTHIPNVSMPTAPIPPPRGQHPSSFRDHGRQSSNPLPTLHYPRAVQAMPMKKLGVSRSFDENYGHESNASSAKSMGPVPNMKFSPSSKSSFTSVIPRKALQSPPQAPPPKQESNQMRSPVSKVFPNQLDFSPVNQNVRSNAPGGLLTTGRAAHTESQQTPLFDSVLQMSLEAQAMAVNTNGDGKSLPQVTEQLSPQSLASPSSGSSEKVGGSPTGPSVVDGFMQIKTIPAGDPSVPLNRVGNEGYGDGMMLTPVVSKVMRGPEQQRATITSREMSSVNDDKQNRRSTAISNISSILNHYQSSSTEQAPQIVRPQPLPISMSPVSAVHSAASETPSDKIQQAKVTNIAPPPRPEPQVVAVTPTKILPPTAQAVPEGYDKEPLKSRRQSPNDLPRQKSLPDLPKIAPNFKYTKAAQASHPTGFHDLPKPAKEQSKLVKVSSVDDSVDGVAVPPSVAEIKKAFMRQIPGRSSEQIQRTASGTSIFERTKSLYISVQDLPPPPSPKKKGPTLPRSKYFFPKQYEAQMSPDSADKKQKEVLAYFAKGTSQGNGQHLRKSASHSKIMNSQQSQAVKGDDDVDQIFDSLFKASGPKKDGVSAISTASQSSNMSSTTAAPANAAVTAKKEEKNSTSKSPGSPGLPSGAPLFQFTNPALKSGAASAKEILLYWCQCRTRDYENVKIENFSSSWSNGLAFCALVHHYFPDAFDYGSLDPKNRRKNFDLAFKVAEEKADIYPLLDTEDMLIMGNRPDWKCVFTYVQSMYRKLKDRD